MSDTMIEVSAREIMNACAQGRLIEATSVGAPATLAEAYAIQDRLFALRGARQVAGWFASATNRQMLRQLGLDEPYAARWRPDRFMPSPATVRAPGELPIALEAEISFLLGRDLPPRHEPYGEAEVVEAVLSVHPSIEIVISCFADWMNQAPLNLVAEGGTEQFLVYGRGITDWRNIDLGALPVSLAIDGTVKAEGFGRNVLDGPVSVLVWLANHAARRGEGLKAGQMCNTGMCAPVYFASPDERALASFGALGQVAVSVA